MLHKIFFPKQNCVKATQLLVAEQQVKISPGTIEKELTDHPDYPSLLSVSDVLNNYGVKNVAFKTDISKLDNIPVPFVAVLKDTESRYDSITVVNKVKNNTITYFDSRSDKWINVNKATFNSKWPSGIVLMTDEEDVVGEKDYANKIREEKRLQAVTYATFLSLPALVLIAALLAIIQYGIAAVYPALFMLITLAGCIAGGLLIWYELGEYNPVLQQICTAGKKVNCGAILNSKASKIMGVSWSVIGFSYFAGSLLLMLCNNMLTPQTQFTVAWFNVFAVPYVFFSVYYQWRIAKQWCVLCLAVQALLLLQLAVAMLAGWHTIVTFNTTIVGSYFIPVALMYIIPFIALTLLLPALRTAKESKRNKAEFQRLKHNPQVFEALLAKQKTITESTEGLGITLGNPYAKHKIVKVCNPYCGPCAKAHKPIEELLQNNPDVQVQIIFTATNENNDARTQPVKHLLAIEQCYNKEKLVEALNAWYTPEKIEYKYFAEMYPLDNELKEQIEKIEAMSNWCKKTEIKFTPTFFINGYQLPETYNATDLKYFLAI